MSVTSERLRYTIPQAAEALGVSIMTVRRRIWSGDLSIIRDGRLVFITADELHRYAKEGTR